MQRVVVVLAVAGVVALAGTSSGLVYLGQRLRISEVGVEGLTSELRDLRLQMMDENSSMVAIYGPDDKPAGTVGVGNGLQNVVPGPETQGNWNTSLGINALLLSTTGWGQTAVGYNALRDSGIGDGPVGTGVFGNTAIGYNSMVVNSDGFDNTAVGTNTLLNNQSGDDNVAVGVNALRANRTGFDNVALGFDSLMYTTATEGNVAVGGEAGRFLTVTGGEQKTAGRNSIYIGRQAYGGLENDADNEIVIGAYAVGQGSNTVVLGNSAIEKTFLNGEIFINGLSLQEHVERLIDAASE